MMIECRKIRNLLLVATVLSCIMINGCLVVGAAMVVAGATQMVNLAREQYPDINFDTPAPIECTYKKNYSDTFDIVVDTLSEMGEQFAIMDKNTGIIRTDKKNLNDVSWIGKGLGKATFRYEYNIIVRKNNNGIGVKCSAPFWEEKMFLASKEQNSPEASNMMRHIFYRNVNKKSQPIFAKMPETPDQDIRYAPITDISNQIQKPKPKKK